MHGGIPSLPSTSDGVVLGSEQEQLYLKCWHIVQIPGQKNVITDCGHFSQCAVFFCCMRIYFYSSHINRSLHFHPPFSFSSSSSSSYFHSLSDAFNFPVSYRRSQLYESFFRWPPVKDRIEPNTSYFCLPQTVPFQKHWMWQHIKIGNFRQSFLNKPETVIASRTVCLNIF
jgi:hypothetical protein